MRAVEFLTESVQEVTLNDLYHDNYPDQDELIWNFVGVGDFDIPFTVRKINPLDLDELVCDNYGVDDVQNLFKKMQPEQERIISDYQNDPTLSQKIIVLSGRRILDGHHRALAAVLANKPIKYIDVSEEQQDLDEDSEQLKFTVKKGKNTFSVQLLSDNNVIGNYQYDNRTNRHIAEVLPKYRGKGHGKLLLLKALDTANKLGFDFIEDESRTSEYDNMLDSLQNSGYVVSDDGQLYLTQNGLDYLNNKVNQFVNEVSIDNEKGQGATPDNEDIDYLGLRVKMKPSTFLKLAAKIDDYKHDYIEKHIGQGGSIAAPTLRINIPDGWTIGDFREPARVSNHDGRHRMAAVLKLEGDKPVETHIFPRYHRHKHMTPEFIKNLNKTLINQDGVEVKGPFFKL